ncbi:hypothetical protein AQ490_01430 [Wenjunlia vitaminophila]|uniref:Uncharacterized protein n=1 Tax=Wenjunlia vitaminophila TaxID=76728 RepID=A0A0T6LZK2_WENVI|nr:hypothetical protein AQ490_01430 [Wenjunlia vitaminophila]
MVGAGCRRRHRRRRAGRGAVATALAGVGCAVGTVRVAEVEVMMPVNGVVGAPALAERGAGRRPATPCGAAEAPNDTSRKGTTPPGVPGQGRRPSFPTAEGRMRAPRMAGGEVRGAAELMVRSPALAAISALPWPAGGISVRGPTAAGAAAWPVVSSTVAPEGASVPLAAAVTAGRGPASEVIGATEEAGGGPASTASSVSWCSMIPWRNAISPTRARSAPSTITQEPPSRTVSSPCAASRRARCSARGLRTTTRGCSPVPVNSPTGWSATNRPRSIRTT